MCRPDVAHHASPVNSDHAIEIRQRAIGIADIARGTVCRAVYVASTIFAGQHVGPPSEGEFPDVVVPEWSRLIQYIGAGDLHNSHHRQQPSTSAGGEGRSATKTLTPSGKKGYCYAWATAKGCHREERHCDFAHVYGPAKPRDTRIGGGGRSYAGRGGGSGGEGSKRDDERASSYGGSGGGGGSSAQH